MGEVVIYDGRGNKFPSNFNLRRLLVFHFSLGLVILRNQLLIGSSSEEMQQRSKYQLFPYIHIYVSFFFFQPPPTLILSNLKRPPNFCSENVSEQTRYFTLRGINNETGSSLVVVVGKWRKWKDRLERKKKKKKVGRLTHNASFLSCDVRKKKKMSLIRKVYRDRKHHRVDKTCTDLVVGENSSNEYGLWIGELTMTFVPWEKKEKRKETSSRPRIESKLSRNIKMFRIYDE